MKDTGFLTCRLCGQEFKPKRVWQKFCCPRHQKLYWKQANPLRLKEELARIKNEIEELVERIGRVEDYLLRLENLNKEV